MLLPATAASLVFACKQEQPAPPKANPPAVESKTPPASASDSAESSKQIAAEASPSAPPVKSEAATGSASVGPGPAVSTADRTTAPPPSPAKALYSDRPDADEAADLDELMPAAEGDDDTTAPVVALSTLPPFEMPTIDFVGIPSALRTEIEKTLDAARKSPGNPTLVGGLGMLYYAASSPLAAAQCFDRATQLQPQAFRWWYYLGLAHIDSYEIDGAVKALTHAARIDPSYAPAWIELAQQMAERDPAAARQYFEKALAIQNGSARAWRGMAELARREGNYEQAEAHARKALAIGPNYAEANETLASVLESLGRTDEAAIYRSRLRTGGKPPLDDDPLRVELLRQGAGGGQILELAEEMARAGRISEAIDVLQETSTKNPDDLGVRYVLGVLLTAKGRLFDAEREFRAILEKDPYQFKALVRLARTRAALGAYSEAEKLLREVLRQGTDDVQALTMYGELLLQLGRYDVAINYCQTLIRSQPKDPTHRIMLAQALLCMGRYEAAIDAYREALKLMPDAKRPAVRFLRAVLRLMVRQEDVGTAFESGAARLTTEGLAGMAGALRVAGLNDAADVFQDYVTHAVDRALLLAARHSYSRALGYLKAAIGPDEDCGRSQVRERLESAVAEKTDDPTRLHLYATLLSFCQQHEQADAQWEKLTREHPDRTEGFLVWSVELLNRGRYAEAQRVLASGLKTNPRALLLANAMAWALSTSPDSALRDGQQAIKWAKTACELAAEMDPELLDTLAVSYAAAGRFAEAIEAEQEAIKLAGRLGLSHSIPVYRDRLQRFEDRQPFVQEP